MKTKLVLLAALLLRAATIFAQSVVVTSSISISTSVPTTLLPDRPGRTYWEFNCPFSPAHQLPGYVALMCVPLDSGLTPSASVGFPFVENAMFNSKKLELRGTAAIEEGWSCIALTTTRTCATKEEQ